MSRTGVIQASVWVLPILGLANPARCSWDFANFLGIVCALADLCYREPSCVDLAQIYRVLTVPDRTINLRGAMAVTSSIAG